MILHKKMLNVYYFADFVAIFAKLALIRHELTKL